MEKSKKLAPVYIMDILKRFSNEDNPLLHAEVERFLWDYGIDLERKAVSSNINMLVDAGLVESLGKKRGCYYGMREFEDSELRLLIHSVLCNPSIPKNQTRDLIYRLQELGGEKFNSFVDSFKMLDGWSKSENQEIFLNMDVIDEAVIGHYRVQYDYYKYGVDKKLHLSSTHIISPYYVMMRNQRFFLIGHSEEYDSIVFHRLDRIKNIKSREKEERGKKKYKPLRMVKGYENGIDFKYVSSSLPYMYSDDPVPVTFKADVDIVDQIVDWFGDEVTFEAGKAGKDQVRATVITSPTAMEYWAKQYLDKVEIVAPLSLKKKMKESLEKGVEKYSSKKR